MSDQYQIDLEKYSLRKFKQSLQTRKLIPSRASLREELDARFSILENSGISNLKELVDALKTKAKVEQFSRETGLSIEYLTLLNREAKSYLSKPIRLDKFPDVETRYLARLDSAGIRNTRQLFAKAQNKDWRERFAQETDIPLETVNELIGLSDLSRIYGVGTVFARIIFDVGIKSVKAFVEYTAEDFIRIYEEQTKKKADFGVGEIEFSLELAKELNSAVEI